MRIDWKELFCCLLALILCWQVIVGALEAIAWLAS